MNQRREGCAARRHQRIKCREDCISAPYMPVSQYRDFVDGQQLYRVSYMKHILKQIEPDKRSEAIRSIMMETNGRKDDPVKGVVGIINKLQSQLQLRKRELVNAKAS